MFLMTAWTWKSQKLTAAITASITCRKPSLCDFLNPATQQAACLLMCIYVFAASVVVQKLKPTSTNAKIIYYVIIASDFSFAVNIFIFNFPFFNWSVFTLRFVSLIIVLSSIYCITVRLDIFN